MNKLPLFSACGIEFEYMVVRNSDLSIMPIVDTLFKHVANEYVCDVDIGLLDWSNELALHVLELKTKLPEINLLKISNSAAADIRTINELLKNWNSCLLPTAMHPWMNPKNDTKLWPHEYSEVYQAFHRVFNCYGHGWSNLQSLHINLPFANDDEFGRLHAAIRIILPLLPALAASSPFVEGKYTGYLDNRLRFYMNNCSKIPEITGDVIPEPIFSIDQYQNEILENLYHAIKPYDSEGILQHEWLNARGAIARFDRYTIEIRLLDIQECPSADLAIASLIVAALKGLVFEALSSYESQKKVKTSLLKEIFLKTIHQGDQAIISDLDYLSILGIKTNTPKKANYIWSHIYNRFLEDPVFLGLKKYIANLIVHGCLAKRLVNAWSDKHQSLTELYLPLEKCLKLNCMFLPQNKIRQFSKTQTLLYGEKM